MHFLLCTITLKSTSICFNINKVHSQIFAELSAISTKYVVFSFEFYIIRSVSYLLEIYLDQRITTLHARNVMYIESKYKMTVNQIKLFYSSYTLNY